MNHISELKMTCPTCGGDGYFEGYSCNYLGSDGRVECVVCGGSGEVETEPVTFSDLA